MPKVDSTAQLKPHRQGDSKKCFVAGDSHEVGVKAWSHTGKGSCCFRGPVFVLGLDARTVW